MAAILGTAVGFGLFFLLRIPVAGIPFIGQPFFPADCRSTCPTSSRSRSACRSSPRWRPGSRCAGCTSPRSASPAGRRRKPPRAWRVIPLLAGLAELGFWTVHGHPARSPGRSRRSCPASRLILVGLFIAGPWLTMAAARAMARWTSRPGTLIAARRLADDPRAAFRAVSGLVLALFITTVAVVAITTQNAKNLTRVRHRGGVEHAD